MSPAVSYLFHFPHAMLALTNCNFVLAVLAICRSWDTESFSWFIHKRNKKLLKPWISIQQSPPLSKNEVKLCKLISCLGYPWLLCQHCCLPSCCEVAFKLTFWHALQRNTCTFIVAITTCTLHELHNILGWWTSDLVYRLVARGQHFSIQHLYTEVEVEGYDVYWVFLSGNSLVAKDGSLEGS